MGVEQDSETEKSFYIPERVSTRAIEAQMSNYTDAQLAFLELIDNAVDDRIPGQPCLIRIRISKTELSVRNEGGEGLDRQGLFDFFEWGNSEKVGRIGSYGVGGKAAMGYLARSMEVICSSNGSTIEYRVADKNWEARPEGEWKNLRVDPRRADSTSGYFRVRLADIKREVSTRALISRLGETYRPILLDKSVQIVVNNTPVEPFDIGYKEDDPELKSILYNLQTRSGHWIEMRVGIIREGENLKPGIRCYYRGRLIEDEQFFGLKTPGQMPQMSRFTGEAHLDFCRVTPNKSHFIKSDPGWMTASKRIHDQLELDWRKKLENLKVETKVQVDQGDQKIAQQAKRILEDVLALTLLVTKKDIPGESEGRLPKGPSTGTIRFNSGEEGSKEKMGQTAPRLGASGETIKRWGPYHRWEVVSMGRTDKRGEVVEEEGKRVLKFNADYPLFQANKTVGDDAKRIYMTETAAMLVAQEVTEGKSIEEYIDTVDRLLSECGTRFNIRLEGRRERKENKTK